MSIYKALRRMEREDGTASLKQWLGTRTYWLIEASDAGLDQRNAPELDEETGFELLGLAAAARLLRGDEIIFVHRHHGYECVGGFYLDLDHEHRVKTAANPQELTPGDE